MPIQTNCSSCSIKIKVEEVLIGKAVKCPKCGEHLVISADGSVADERSKATTLPVPDASVRTPNGATVSYLPGQDTEPGSGPANDLPTVPGYRVLREIARGGMGRVLAAHDVNLDRPVALKILLPGANADRFVRESKITAQLPHPGIPPVHALGTLADGSPFLAMKFIAGQTLAAEMKSADRARLLQVFVRVCQAVGFAHSRGIIHRDLKPANVMVGAFGEVQVMDWGLAKELAGREVGDERRSSEARAIPIIGADVHQTADYRAPAESTDDQTRAGQVMGTPAYMAPEQARGEASDTRADVFALGGILCAILTGQPPFCGRSAQEVIQHAGAADLGETMTRLDHCGADTELIDLTKICLAPNAIDRPKDGQALAEAMTAYLEGVEQRLHQAEVAVAEAKARAAEVTKRRRLALVLAATVVFAVALGGVGWLWVKADQDAHLAQVTSDVNDALSQACALREQAKEATEAGMSLALFARSRAQAQRAWTLAESGPVDDQLTGRVQTLQTELAAEEAVVGKAMEFYRRAGALDPKYVHETQMDEAISLYRRAIEIFPKYVNAYAGLGAALMAKGQTNEAIECFRQAIALDSRDANAHVGMGAALKAKGKTDQAIASYRRALALDPQRATAHTGLGSALHLQGKLAEAIDCHNQAIAVDPKLASAHINLGLALAAKGQTDKAIECYRQAITLDPKDANGHACLGLALVGKWMLDEAVASCRQAIGLNPKLALAHAGLGCALAGKRQIDEALQCYRQAIALDQKLALAHTNLGVALISKRQVEEAIASCRRAVALDPLDANTHIGLGLALNAKGETDEAIDSCNRAIALAANNANAHFVLGDALLGKLKTEEAIASYRQAIALDPKHVPAYANLGCTLGAKGEYVEAIARCRQALTLAPKDIDANYWMGVALIHKGNAEGRDVNEVVREAGKYIELAGILDKRRVDDLLNKSVKLTDYYREKNKEPGKPAPTDLVHEVGAKVLELRGELDKQNPARTYQVKLAAGKAYVIDMTSSNPKSLDPFLVLADAADKKLAEDDDSGGGLNARIVFHAEQAGSYRIQARSFGNKGVGPFTLTVRESANKPMASLATARNHAARGDWKAAVAEYTQAFLEQPLRDGERGFECAAVLFLSGDQAGYRKMCIEMLERSGQPGIRPYHVARACTLAPDSVKDLVLAGKKAANELKNSGTEFWSLTEQGALEYRAGRYDEAANLFAKSLQADRKVGRAVVNWVWLSLVKYRRGKPAEAHAWLDKATKWLEQYPKGLPSKEDETTGLHLHNWLEVQILHREAAALLRLKK